MHFDSTISILEQKLAKPLPGLISHRKYMHTGRLNISENIPENVRKSAVLILIYPVDNNAYFPLILRPKYDGRHGGQMALPGGKEEPSDENLIRTALREAQEEIGIKAIDVQILGELTDVYIPISNFTVHPVVGCINYKPDFFPDEREVDKIYLTDLEDLMKGREVVSKEIVIGKQKISVPGFEIQGSWVWGATSLILSELSDVLRE